MQYAQTSSSPFKYCAENSTGYLSRSEGVKVGPGNRCFKRLDMQWNIGCSGYHYPEWKRLFYPEDLAQRKWFEHYCTRFNTLELNVTYYRFPRPGTLKRWYDRSPHDFTFSVKAPRHITHFKKFSDAQRMLMDFYTAAQEGLREKLGCVLFQFPSNVVFAYDRLMRILDMLDPSIRNVLEFRHHSWWDVTVYEAFSKANTTFCGMSHPMLPETPVKTTDTVYYRFHGVPHLYSSRYELQKLEELAQNMIKQGPRSAYIYFNNTAEGHAVTNAKQLQEICEFVH